MDLILRRDDVSRSGEQEVGSGRRRVEWVAMEEREYPGTRDLVCEYCVNP